ncbi:hypothetical protein PMAYCL1PPCAC_28226, partial [Pristionchus mayeri]
DICHTSPLITLHPKMPPPRQSRSSQSRTSSVVSESEGDFVPSAMTSTESSSSRTANPRPSLPLPHCLILRCSQTSCETSSDVLFDLLIKKNLRDIPNEEI